MYPGSVIKCVTCHGEEFQGEVLAFDCEKRVVIMKQASSSGKPELNNVSVINLDFVKTFQVIKQQTQDPPTLPSLDQKKLQRRYNEELQLKMSLATAALNGVTREGLSLFIFMRKLFKETEWVYTNMVVMEEVEISPPYTRDSCSSRSEESTCLEQVRMMVERFHRERMSTKTQQHGKT